MNSLRGSQQWLSFFAILAWSIMERSDDYGFTYYSCTNITNIGGDCDTHSESGGSNIHHRIWRCYSVCSIYCVNHQIHYQKKKTQKLRGHMAPSFYFREFCISYYEKEKLG